MIESTDVWTLAGVKPTAAMSFQPTMAIDMSGYWQALPDWLSKPLEEYILTHH